MAFVRVRACVPVSHAPVTPGIRFVQTSGTGRVAASMGHVGRHTVPPPPPHTLTPPPLIIIVVIFVCVANDHKAIQRPPPPSPLSWS